MFFLLFGLFLLLLILVPIGIAYLIFRFLSKKGYKKIGLIVLFSVIVGMIYIIYTAIYPTDSFYKDEFENFTEIEFPKSAKIVWKDSSYPDIHGDYQAGMIFIADSADYENLLNRIKNNSKVSTDTINYRFEEGEITFAKENSTRFSSVWSDDERLPFTLIFRSDGHYIYFSGANL
ncbi:MAG: hypothetical protein H3C39_06630 [Flavobacteriia bacterium]|nr:hypothetical protein [Flavobacteriia bacterium]